MPIEQHSAKDQAMLRSWIVRVCFLGTALGLNGVPIVHAQGPLSQGTSEQLEFFEKKIRPLFVEHCYLCHSEHHKEAGGLRVDDFRAITRIGSNGPVVLPGDSTKSHLITRVTHPEDGKTMPPDYRLSESQIADLKQWIDAGAAWPPTTIPNDSTQSLQPGELPNAELKDSHWAWQPIPPSKIPDALELGNYASWSKNAIDIYTAKGWIANGLEPVEDAPRSILLRRVTFDLTGLPPSEDELLEFLLDESPNAFERVVDRLLKSQAFGERWGRHWLDVARYGESTGSARNLPYPHAWRYRDYVIASYNADKPFDRFLHEQIAGDLLPSHSLVQKREQLIATGFLALGVKDVNQRFKARYDMDNVDEQIDTVSKAFLGLTVSCARCHDHKFEPISTRDYYALAGIFLSTELCDALKNQMGGAGLAYYVPDRLISIHTQKTEENPEELERRVAVAKTEFETARTEFQRIRDSVKQEERGEEHAQKLKEARQRMQKKQAELVALSDPAKRGDVALGVRDAKSIADAEIRIRGEAEKIGPVVPRGFLAVLDRIPDKGIGEDESGRRELAKWLTHRDNPLTSRVYVNRVWQHLFGNGLVRTVDNFGSTGDQPSHPQLLDHLASDFVKEGWSTKKLIRKIVLSRTYQLASTDRKESRERDPENRLLWRHSPRRMDAEELRDTILFLSGSLDTKSPIGSAAQDLPVIEIRNNGPEAKNLLTAAATSKSRSVYLPVVRGITPNSLEVFDFAEQGMVTGQRSLTTVAPQALFLLNDGFVRKHTSAIAASIPLEPEDLKERKQQNVIRLVRRILQRYPTESESERFLAFLDDYQKGWQAVHGSGTENQIAASADGDAKVTETNATSNNAAAPEDTRDVEFNLDAAVGAVRPGTADEAAWTALVQAILASAEFRYVR
ncbi:MAG: DUF1553 domain-containing protein [Planctomycetes bacterium]|nr:DUF1553 domain-containing protein [Planctomycetota bacterium]